MPGTAPSLRNYLPCLTFFVLRRLLPLIVLLSACSGGSHPAKPKPSAANQLSDLAARAATASYAASYEFREASSNATATVNVWRAPPALRVDVIVGGTTASLIVGSTATYSCSSTSKAKSCLTVATANQPLPAPFDVAPANLFTVDVQQLATSIRDYDVTTAPAASPSGQVPAATCWKVTPAAGVADAKVPAGTYCFSAAGLLTAATYPSGNTIRLVSAQTATPAPTQFSPYAKPTPLPTSTK